MAAETQYYKPPFRPISRSNEIRTGDSEWLRMQHRVDIAPQLQDIASSTVYVRPAGIPRGAPVNAYSLTSPDPNTAKSRSGQLAPLAGKLALPASVLAGSKVQNTALGRNLKSPYQPFEDSSRRDEYYNRYLQLSQNVAERYPDPGEPRERQGAIGGSWRHIKEVLGNTGSRTLFVDGLVSLYDMDINTMRSRNAPWERQISGSRYGISRHDVDGYKSQCESELERKSYKPWDHDTDRMPPINDTTRQLPGSPTKYKGFYTTR